MGNSQKPVETSAVPRRGTAAKDASFLVMPDGTIALATKPFAADFAGCKVDLALPGALGEMVAAAAGRQAHGEAPTLETIRDGGFQATATPMADRWGNVKASLVSLKAARSDPHEGGGDLASALNARRTLEESIAKAKEAMEKADAARNAFLARVAHELKTPLTPLLGFVELLAEAGNLPAEQLEWAAIIRDRAMEIARVVGNLVDLTLLDAGQAPILRQKTGVLEFFAELANPHSEAAAARGIAFRLDLAPNLPPRMRTDAKRLRMALDNVIGNTIAFTSGRQVRCRVQTAPQGAFDILVTDAAPDVPLTPEHFHFKRVDHYEDFIEDGHWGAPIGLALAKKIVDAMGGEVSLDFHTAQASTFRLTVPSGTAADRGEEPLHSPRPPTPSTEGADAVRGAARPKIGSGLKALLVEDDTSSRLFARCLLEHLGFDVKAAASGHEAVALCASNAFDIVFMDIQMPGMSGVEAMRAIRSLAKPDAPRMSFIAITALVEEGKGGWLLDEGMDAYVPKPLRRGAVVDAIAEVLRRNPPPPQSR